MNSDPLVTCALPTWRSSGILWLQLESLCRQIAAPPFEVLVCEERHRGMAGRAYVEAWRGRLAEAGCSRLAYVALPRRVSLFYKWVYLAYSAAPASRAYAFCASDNYSPPDRLARTYHTIEEDDQQWFSTLSGHFYNILTGDLALWDRTDRLDSSGLFMATKTDMMRRLPLADGPASGIDGHLRRALGVSRFASDKGPAGLHTDGYNTISHKRRCLYAGGAYRHPFLPPLAPDLVALGLPRHVAGRLMSLCRRDL